MTADACSERFSPREHVGGGGVGALQRQRARNVTYRIALNLKFRQPRGEFHHGSRLRLDQRRHGVERFLQLLWSYGVASPVGGQRAERLKNERDRVFES